MLEIASQEAYSREWIEKQKKADAGFYLSQELAKEFKKQK